MMRFLPHDIFYRHLFFTRKINMVSRHLPFPASYFGGHKCFYMVYLTYTKLNKRSFFEDSSEWGHIWISKRQVNARTFFTRWSADGWCVSKVFWLNLFFFYYLFNSNIFWSRIGVSWLFSFFFSYCRPTRSSFLSWDQPSAAQSVS